MLFRGELVSEVVWNTSVTTSVLLWLAVWYKDKLWSLFFSSMFCKSGADFRRTLRTGLFECLLTLLEISFQSSRWLLLPVLTDYFFFPHCLSLAGCAELRMLALGVRSAAESLPRDWCCWGFVLQAVRWDVGTQCWDSVSFTWSSETPGGTSSSQLGQGLIALV